MIFGELDEKDYSDIWSAPEEADYGLQGRSPGDREWRTLQVAVTKKGAMDSLNISRQTCPVGYELRVVKISRYPPCPVLGVIYYYQEK